MKKHLENSTPPGFPTNAEASAAAATGNEISQLSLDNDRSTQRVFQSRRGRGTLGAAPVTAAKRAARTEPLRPPGRQSLRVQNSQDGVSAEPQNTRTHRRSPRSRKLNPRQNVRSAQRSELLNCTRRDSGYTGLILQPYSSPLSQDQLAAEVKGIYAELVVVEAKCINIDTAQAAEPKSVLGAEHWQALIALHRTLLYEHHDFLMATQHPSATSALRGLATKYSMPARMWKHGIHAFLEVLRYRRPDTQEYMLSFIYLAYQMIALLFETVPVFTDMWIECLGDLALYRMAIEEEKEAHTTWGGVAARWYTMASDRHPLIGRLNHNLGILEPPSLRKLFLYAKSLTSVISFPNARDSLATLCGPIVQDEQALQTGNHTAEARIVKLHAESFLACDEEVINTSASDALEYLGREPATHIRDTGVPLIVTNIAALLELGSPTNSIWQVYCKAVNYAIPSSRPSVGALTGSLTSGPENRDPSPPLTITSSSSLMFDFCYSVFNTLIQHRYTNQSVRHALPSVHTILVWMHSLHSLQSRLDDDLSIHTCSALMNPARFSWGGLSDYLNLLGETEPITARTMECARQGIFIVPERSEDAFPLSEDYLTRGLIWTQFYFPPRWFDEKADEDSRVIETPSMQRARVERVQWLGLYLAFRTKSLQYNVHTQSFLAPVAGPLISAKIHRD